MTGLVRRFQFILEIFISCQPDVTDKKWDPRQLGEMTSHVKEGSLLKENGNNGGFQQKWAILAYRADPPHMNSALDLLFVTSPREKVIIVPDTNYITSAIRRFMLNMVSLCSLRFQNIDF